MQELAKSVINDKPIDIPAEYSEGMNFLVKKLLTKDPLRRPTVEQILEYEIIRELTNDLPEDVNNHLSMVKTIR